MPPLENYDQKCATENNCQSNMITTNKPSRSRTTLQVVVLQRNWLALGHYCGRDVSPFSNPSHRVKVSNTCNLNWLITWFN